jgi:hypothetical protein
MVGRRKLPNAAPEGIAPPLGRLQGIREARSVADYMPPASPGGPGQPTLIGRLTRAHSMGRIWTTAFCFAAASQAS